MSRSERLLIYAALALTLLLPGAPSGCDRLRAADDFSGREPPLALLTLLQPPPPPAAPAVTLPADFTMPVLRLASVPVTFTGKTLRWRVLGGDVDSFREYDPDPQSVRLRLIAYPTTARAAGVPARVVYVVAVAIGADGRSSEETVCTITIADPTPPPPPPPPPTDPLTAVLQAAYDADAGPTKAAALATLADIHAKAADLAADPSVTTYGQLAGAVHTVAVGKLGDKPGGQLLGVRSAIGAEEAKAFAGTTATPLTAASRADLQKWYARVSAALKGVKP